MNIKLGGTDLPMLRGKITDTEGGGLHGVWVRLENADEGELKKTGIVWSEVTEKDGSYEIYDIPPGRYKLHCFRRLALNNYSRTLQAEKTITINDHPEPKTESQPLTGRAENICNVKIDLEPFMPLEFGQVCPDFSGKLLSGESFSLNKQRGKIVVLHFYTSWCSICVRTMPDFDQLAEKFGPDKLLVLGISLDKTIGEQKQLLSKSPSIHSHLFAGPWTQSEMVKLFRVINVPTTIIIDAEGKIAQMDLFGDVLEKFITDTIQQNL